MEPLSFDLEAVPVPPCGVSRLSLRRFHVGELPAEERERLTAHTASCLDCQTVLADLRSDEAAFRTHVPFPRFLEEHQARAAAPLAGQARRLWSWLLGGGSALALAGALGVFVVMPQLLATPSPVEQVETRLKGSLVAYWFQTPQGMAFGQPGQSLKEGDRVQFFLRAPVPDVGVVLLGVDGRGAVTVYHAGKAPQQPAPLADSLVLDDAVGPERFFAVYGPGKLEELQKTAQKAAEALVAQKADLRVVERLPLDGAVKQDSVLIVKVAR